MSRTRVRVLLVAGCLPALALTMACGNRNSHTAVVAAANGAALTSSDQNANGLVGGPTTTSGSAAAPTSSAPSPGVGSSTPSSGSGSAAVGDGGGTTTGSTATIPTTTASKRTSVSTPTTAKTNTPTATATSAAATVRQDTTPVVICQVGSFSGAAGPPLGNAQPGLSAWVRYTNAHGGLAGHPVQLDSKDDAGDGNKALQIVQNCVQNEHAVAVVAAFLPVTIDNVSSYLANRKIPVVGGDGLTATWYSNPYFFPEGSSPTALATGYIRLMKAAGKHTLAIVYCSDSPACSDSAKLVAAAAQKGGMSVKGTYQVTTANPSFTSQCSQMKSDGVDAVYPAFDSSSVQRLARDCVAIGFRPLWVTGGLAMDADAVSSDPNLDGMQVTTLVFPWMTSATPATQAFQAAMATYAPDVSPSESAAKAWTAGMVLQKALSNLGSIAVGGPITSATILQGLATIKHDSLGGLVMGQLNYNAGAPVTPNSSCWGVAELTGGKWIAPKGGSAQCT